MTTSFRSAGQKKLDEAIARVDQTVDTARRALADELSCYRGIVIDSDEGYLEQALKALAEENLMSFALKPDQETELESLLAATPPIVFLMAPTEGVLAILARHPPLKLVVMASEEEHARHHRLFSDLGAIVVRSKVSPECLKLAV